MNSPNSDLTFFEVNLLFSLLPRESLPHVDGTRGAAEVQATPEKLLRECVAGIVQDRRLLWPSLGFKKVSRSPLPTLPGLWCDVKASQRTPYPPKYSDNQGAVVSRGALPQKNRIRALSVLQRLGEMRKLVCKRRSHASRRLPGFCCAVSR